MESHSKQELSSSRGCPDSVRVLSTNRDLLCYWQPGMINNNMADELVSTSWNMMSAFTPEDVKHLSEHHTFTVGILFINSDLTLEDIDMLYTVITADDQMVWLALLNDGRRMSDDVCSLIATYCNDFFTPPYDSKRILDTLGHASGLSRIRHRSLAHRNAPANFHGMIGESPPMRNLFRKIQKYANSDAPVLLEGESGVGKEVAANAIHRLSSRASKPFVAVNCAALPGTLIQSELFGCEKGAFTGASERRMGRFEAADGGVLFLDEISDMPLDQQVNLLRFLETRSVERLGGNGGITVDVRIIAATNENLEIAVKEGRFRKDLFYRLGVLQLAIPSLRDRSADVALLANQVLSSYGSERRGKHILGFDQQAQQMMRSHTWPGNVRELINRVRSAVVMTEGHYISAADLGLVKGAASPPQFQNTLEANRTECDRRTIESALACSQHNMSQAARELGVSRTTLYRMVDKLAISVA